MSAAAFEIAGEDGGERVNLATFCYIASLTGPYG